MAQDFNQHTITGRLGNDPEMRFMPDGKAVCSFRVANNRRDKNGQKQDARWYKATAFGKTAETFKNLMDNYGFGKGSQILITGENDYEEWEGQNGEKRFTPTITINQFTLLGSKGDNQGSRQPTAADLDNDPSYEGPGSNSDWIEKGTFWLNRHTGEKQAFS